MAKFITNTIRTGRSRTFKDLVDDYKKQQDSEATIKTAAVAEVPVKTAESEDKDEDKKETQEETGTDEKDAKAKAEVKVADAKADDEEKSGDSKVEDKEEDKKAEEEVEIKIAEEKDEADSSGQLDVEPLHQKGESTPSPHKEKDKGGSGAGGKTAGDKDEADSSGQPEWEGKKEHNNDPEAGKHREGDGDQKNSEAVAEKKEAESKDEKKDVAKTASHCPCPDDCVCKGGDRQCDNGCEAKACMASEEKEIKTAGCFCKKDCPGGSECNCGCNICGKASADKDDKESADKSESKVATTEMPRFMKVANLDDRTKTWLRKYWKNLYPPEYVEAMLADK